MSFDDHVLLASHSQSTKDNETPSVHSPSAHDKGTQDTSMQQDATPLKSGAHQLVTPSSIHGQPGLITVDCAAAITVVNARFFTGEKWPEKTECAVNLKGISPMKVIGFLAQDITFTLGRKTYQWNVCIAPVDEDMLLGIDFIQHHQADILISEMTLDIRGNHVPLSWRDTYSHNKPSIKRVTKFERILMVPAQHQAGSENPAPQHHVPQNINAALSQLTPGPHSKKTGGKECSWDCDHPPDATSTSRLIRF